MTDPIVRLDRLLLWPFYRLCGGVFIHARRYGVSPQQTASPCTRCSAAGETPTPLPFGTKNVNANSNSQAQRSCQPRLSHLHADACACEATRSSERTLSFLITFKAFRKFIGFVIQRSQRPSGQGAAKPNRGRHPPGGARCCFFGNEWETRRPDVPATPSPTRARRWCR